MQRLAVFHQGSIDLLVPVRPHVQPSVHEVGRGYGLERPRRLLPALRLLARRCFLPSAYWNSQFREPLRAAESRSGQVINGRFLPPATEDHQPMSG